MADAGPHQAGINNGSMGVSADSCAGCHRAHSAKSAAGDGRLLISSAATVSDFCLTCHGDIGAGATTNVESGLQYRPVSGSPDVRGGTVLGALRNGGFGKAAIASDRAYRIIQPYSIPFPPYVLYIGVPQYSRTKVPVAAQAGLPNLGPTTSSHIPSISELTGGSRAWGNGALNSGPGPSMTLECTSCHNPHGNGNYRILRNDLTGGTGFVAGTQTNVTDAPPPASGDARNYTVIQTPASPGYLLLASQVITLGYSSTSGDYFHAYVPWNGNGSDAPNGQPNTFTSQMTAWCTVCHTRYLEPNTSGATYSGDSVFSYRHVTTGSSTACTTCHVAHGSNAVMSGTYSAFLTNPGDLTAGTGDSRLLKIDNRGTCQACHDPTGSAPATAGPTPDPITP